MFRGDHPVHDERGTGEPEHPQRQQEEENRGRFRAVRTEDQSAHQAV